MKVIIAGCTHAGTAATAAAAKRYPGSNITIYERNDTVSFLSCGIALYLSGVVKDPQGLFYSSPDELKKLGAVTKMRHEITGADLAGKKLTVRNVQNGDIFTDTYDKLIITTGSWPAVPKVPGADFENVVLCKNYGHAKNLFELAGSARNIAVIGAGYIGVEIAEAFRSQGKDVTLIDMEDRILGKYLDSEFTGPVERALGKAGVVLALSQPVKRFEGSSGRVEKVVTQKGAYDADLVVISSGFRPNTAIFRGQLDMADNGAIFTDGYMRTSMPDVFAAGDAAASFYNPSGKSKYVALATGAVRSGTLAALNLCGPVMKSPGTQGTSGIKAGGYNIAVSGLCAGGAAAEGIDFGTADVRIPYRPEFMPTHEDVLLRVVYRKDDRRIIGGEIMSKADLTQSANVLSVCIEQKMTVDRLAFEDFFFQPNYNSPWNFLNSAGLAALKV